MGECLRVQQRARPPRQHVHQPPRRHHRRRAARILRLIPLPRVMRSGTTPYGSSADQVPVRPAPVSTSSATSRTSCRLQAPAPGGQYPGSRHRGPGRRAADRLGDDRGDGLGPFAQRCAASTASPLHAGQSGGCPAAFAPVGVRRRHPDHLHQPLPKVGPVVLPRRGRERQQCVAVIGGGQRDDLVLLGPPDLDPVLAGQLEGRFDRLRAARERIHQIEIAGRQPGDLRRQLLHRIMGEGRAVHVGQPAACAPIASAISPTP